MNVFDWLVQFKQLFRPQNLEVPEHVTGPEHITEPAQLLAPNVLWATDGNGRTVLHHAVMQNNPMLMQFDAGTQ